MQCAFEMDGDSGDRPAVFIAIFTTQNSRKGFRLRIWSFRVKGKSNPEGQANRVQLVAGEKQASAGSISRFALLCFLTKWRGPAEPYRKAETHPEMLAALHSS